MTGPRARNEALVEALREAGLTYDRLASEVRAVARTAGEELRTNKSAVAHWVGGTEPQPRTTVYVAEAVSRALGRETTPSELGFEDPGDEDRSRVSLGMYPGADPVEVLRLIGEADIHRRRLLTNAAYSVAAAGLPLGVERSIPGQRREESGGFHAGRSEIDAVREMTRMFTRIDERHGGQHGRTAVVQYLTTDVVRLCRASFTREADRADMLGAAAEVAYLCGWKAYDAGEHGLAQRYQLQAYELTMEAGDEAHQAFILRILAHNGMDVRRPEHTLDLADAALSRARGRVEPATEALFAVTRARALANAGRPAEAARQLRAAQDLVLRGDETELPHWAALWGSARACVSSHTAKTVRGMGDHVAAERHYAAAARARPGPEYQRITALTLAAQGGEQAALGHVEQACGTWGRALDLLEDVRSARAVDAVDGMRRTLVPLRGRGARIAEELDERARAWHMSHA
ncbi:hypothetical protein [Streptomyces sp. ST2-7A]|uniref:hypothetical protein n=1 Tax=Streptomyces sp. ST2-7A TaxID=2907214 RepID=UPI001F3B6085|nr:hypothetical protein [Streptomyces sp. ST2-7A]MCE7081434.1 hypothetical protein [Streptomyces sp. ST2-7A]